MLHSVPGRYTENGKACCSDSLPACPPSDKHHFSVSQTGSLFLWPGFGPESGRADGHKITYWYQTSGPVRRRKWIHHRLPCLAELFQLFVGVWVQFLRDILHPEQRSSVLGAGLLHAADRQQRVSDGAPPERLHFLLHAVQRRAQRHPVEKMQPEKWWGTTRTDKTRRHSVFSLVYPSVGLMQTSAWQKHTGPCWWRPSCFQPSCDHARPESARKARARSPPETNLRWENFYTAQVTADRFRGPDYLCSFWNWCCSVGLAQTMILPLLIWGRVKWVNPTHVWFCTGTSQWPSAGLCTWTERSGRTARDK